MSDVDLTRLTPEELMDLVERANRELAGRQTVAAFSVELGELQSRFRDATGVTREPGDTWRQPVLPLDGYALGDVVTHAGRTWTSTQPVNVWVPGEAAWRETPADGSVAPWRQPSGADPHGVGDLVAFDGHVWESLIFPNVWSPVEYPAGWSRVAGDVPDDVPVVEPEPEPEPEPEEVREWAAGTDYAIGDRVHYQGATYVLIQNHKSAAHWPPDVVASIYRLEE